MIELDEASVLEVVRADKDMSLRVKSSKNVEEMIVSNILNRNITIKTELL